MRGRSTGVCGGTRWWSGGPRRSRLGNGATGAACSSFVQAKRPYLRQGKPRPAQVLVKHRVKAGRLFAAQLDCSLPHAAIAQEGVQLDSLFPEHLQSRVELALVLLHEREA